MLQLPLLIGQAPGPNTDPDMPLYPLPATSAGGRLAKVMGIKPIEYLRLFDRINLLYKFPGKHKRDDKFPMAQARVAARAISPLLRGRRVIIVGRNVANAFGLPADLEFHSWVDHPIFGYRYAIIPHPSGRSRWYNDPTNTHEARVFWAEELELPMPEGHQAEAA